MKRLIGIAVIVVLVGTSLISSISGASASTAHTSLPHNEVTISQSEMPCILGCLGVCLIQETIRNRANWGGGIWRIGRQK